MAQSNCGDVKSPRLCFAQHVGFAGLTIDGQPVQPKTVVGLAGKLESEDFVVALAESSTSRQLALMNTGAPSLDAERSSATKDFITSFLAFAESAGGGKREGDTITFQWNVPFSSDSKKLNLSLALKDPKLDSAVEKALTGKPELEQRRGELGQQDDATFGVAWSFNHASTLRSATAFSDLTKMVAINVMRPQIATALDQSVARQMASLPLEAPASDSGVTTDSLVAGAMIRLRMDAIDSIARIADEAGFLLARPIANQPQFWGEVKYHSRNSLIGASEYGGSFTFEVPNGSTTASELRSKADAVGARKGEMLLTTLETSAAETPAKPRLKITGEFKNVRRRDLVVDSLTTPFTNLLKIHTPSSHMLTVTGVAGWKFSTAAVNRDMTIDLNATYENDSSDTKKKDRLVGSATFTQRISEQLSIPISIVYANHERYLPEVKSKVTAHFGLSYKLPGGTSTKNAAAREFDRARFATD
jgi:hypothetical protein